VKLKRCGGELVCFVCTGDGIFIKSLLNRYYRELAERKAQFAQDISAATMEADNCRRAAEEALRRADEAEEYQRSVQVSDMYFTIIKWAKLLFVQAEIAEAKIVQKYNAQLHKDLLREQLARKKLHNDMEDLKGKIRVYVRIRPFSNSERERGCQEAVFKASLMPDVFGSPKLFFCYCLPIGWQNERVRERNRGTRSKEIL
jgi:hypothetical protein